MDLGYVLRRAWEITRRFKSLWLFGFLVSLGTVGGRFFPGVTYVERAMRGLPPGASSPISDSFARPYATAVIVFVVVLVCAVGIGLVLLGTLGRAALIDQVRFAEDRAKVTLGEGWRAGRDHLWPVFFIRLLLGLPPAIVTMVGVLPVLGMAYLIAGQQRPDLVIPGVFAVELVLLVCLLPAAFLALLISIPSGMLRRLAVRACVLEGHSVRGSIVAAWRGLRRHPGPLTVVWLVLAVLCVGVTVVLIVALGLVAAALIVVVSLVAFVSPQLFAVLALLAGLFVWLVGAGVNSVIEAFTSAVWTLAYRDLMGLGLTGEGVESTA
jgi:hypothetical protein